VDNMKVVDNIVVPLAELEIVELDIVGNQLVLLVDTGYQIAVDIVYRIEINSNYLLHSF